MQRPPALRQSNSLIVRRKYFCFLLLAALFLSTCTRSGEVGINPGDLAPEFTAFTLSGGPAKLSDYRGKVVLLNFWASWCAPCIAEMPALQRLHDRLKDQGFTVLAVGVDDEPEALQEFQRRYGLSFPVLVDQNAETKRLFKTTGVPESFVIGRDGKLVLFMDPDDNSPTVRMSGPREWDSPNVVSRFTKILAEKKDS